MEWKNVRIFISSTFNDMHAERDYLVKHVFPELSVWCEERKLRLIDIDLRWGITAADTRNNHTVYACLHNIDESRPFFLCFLGQRRGWVPGESDISQDTLEIYPGLSGLIGKKAITEMEVEHALLSPMFCVADNIQKSRKPVEHALFFIRDDAYLTQLSENQKQIFTNAADKDPIASDQEFQQFKNFIRKSWPKTFDYAGEWSQQTLSPELSSFPGNIDEGRLINFTCRAKLLSEVIIEQLKLEIMSEFPDHVPTENQSDFEKDLEEQTYFMEQNCQGYIERENDFDTLKNYVYDESRGLMVVTAPGGQGKTSLLSRFAVLLREDPAVRTFARFCGVTDRCGTIYGVWKSILTEAGLPVPSYEDQLVRQIRQVLDGLTDFPGITVLIIDAINQLPNGKDIFRWIPRDLPKNLKLIFSIKEGRDTAEVIDRLRHERTTIMHRVRPFGSRHDKEAVINEYLKNYLKKLDEEHIDAICELPASANPLYLKVMLSELRVFGSFNGLSEEIQRFGNSAGSAFEAMLGRLEQDTNVCSIPSSDFVKLLFGLLAASRYGLSEDEIFACLQKSFPHAEREEISDTVHVYFRQVRGFVSRREGRWDFFYESFRLASAYRYREEKPAFHTFLYEHFSEVISRSGKNDEKSPAVMRAYNEASYHLYMADNQSGKPGKRITELLLSADWIKGKLRSCGADALLADYTQISKECLPEDLAILQRTLQLSIHILREDPDQMEYQFTGRMAEIKNTSIQNLLDKLDRQKKDRWLKPLVKVLPGPEDAKIVILKEHKAKITDFWTSGDKLFTGDADGMLRIWDMNSWQCLRTLQAHNKKEVHIVHCPDDLITWCTGEEMTVVKKWDCYSGSLLAVTTLNEQAKQLEAEANRILGILEKDLTALDSNDLSITEVPEVLRETAEEKIRKYYPPLTQNERLTDISEYYDFAADDRELSVYRKDIHEEPQSDLPINAIALFPDGRYAGGGQFDLKFNDFSDKEFEHAITKMSRITIWDKTGNVIKVIPYPRLDHFSVLENKLICTNWESADYYYEKIGIHETENFTVERSFSTMFAKILEDGKIKTALSPVSSIRSSVMINGDLFCLDRRRNLIVIRNGQNDFEFHPLEERNDNSDNKIKRGRLFSYEGKLGYIKSLWENNNISRSFFRVYDPKTIELLTEKVLDDCIEGAAFSGEKACLIKSSGDYFKYEDKTFLSVWDHSLYREYYQREINDVFFKNNENNVREIKNFNDLCENMIAHPENAVAFSNGCLFAADGSRIIQLDENSGEMVMSAAAEELLFLSLAVSDGILLAGTSTGKVFRFAIRTGIDRLPAQNGTDQANADPGRNLPKEPEDESFLPHQDNMEVLAEIVLKDPDSEKRLDVLGVIEDEEILKKVAANDESAVIRRTAVQKISDQEFLLNIADKDEAESVRIKAVEGIRDPGILSRYIKKQIIFSKCFKNKAFETAVEKCDDEELLFEITRLPTDTFDCPFKATKRMKSYEYRYAVICDPYIGARATAFERMANIDHCMNELLANRVLICDPNFSNRISACYNIRNIKLLMLEYFRTDKQYPYSTPEDVMKELRCGFPGKFNRMSMQKKNEYYLDCFEEVARVAEVIIQEDDRVRKLLPPYAGNTFSSDILYAAICIFSPDAEKRMEYVKKIHSARAMAFTGIWSKYTDVNLYLSSRLTDGYAILAMFDKGFPEYEGLLGLFGYKEHENYFKKCFAEMLLKNLRDDSARSLVKYHMSKAGMFSDQK